jgi:hypothetical protein
MPKKKSARIKCRTANTARKFLCQFYQAGGKSYRGTKGKVQGNQH